MKFPAVSKTTTGGAAIFASSGLSSVRGRWSSQTLSLASIAKLDGSPTLYFGGSLGQALSTSKTGRLLVCAAIPTAPRTSAASAAAQIIVRVTVPSFPASDHVLGGGVEAYRVRRTGARWGLSTPERQY